MRQYFWYMTAVVVVGGALLIDGYNNRKPNPAILGSLNVVEARAQIKPWPYAEAFNVEFVYTEEIPGFQKVILRRIRKESDGVVQTAFFAGLAATGQKFEMDEAVIVSEVSFTRTGLGGQDEFLLVQKR